MGQHITVSAPSVIGDIAVFDTDRSLSGQDGIGFTSADEATATDTFPGRLAARLFAADPAVSCVRRIEPGGSASQGIVGFGRALGCQ